MINFSFTFKALFLISYVVSMALVLSVVSVYLFLAMMVYGVLIIRKFEKL